MTVELSLRFPDPAHVSVRFGDEESATREFASPVEPKDREDLRWYLEEYGAHALGDPDDGEAARIRDRLPVLGKALFDAVFGDRTAGRLFDAFQDLSSKDRLLTVSTEQPAILALPWELLHDPDGAFLFNDKTSIRRRIGGATGGREPFKVRPKQRLHLLFVVSRPDGVGFLDPRADATAVLDALDRHAPGRCTWEFLRPPTIDALADRLRDPDLPAVDILHFDGHGVFDPEGGLPERLANRAISITEIVSGDLVRAVDAPPAGRATRNTGYLVFEEPDGGPDLVGAEQLGQNLNQSRVPLVILSACQTASHGEADEPFGSIAARLTRAGIPAVLAMTYSVLVPTTRALFGTLYGELGRGRAIGVALDNARLDLYNDTAKYEVQRGPVRGWLRLDDWFVPALYQAGPDVPLLRPAKASTSAERAVRRTNVPARPEAGFFGRRFELWTIERAFSGPTRRVTISGFGGQGKTALAQEAARWLTRIGLFEAAVFVDYAQIQGADAVALAVNAIGSVLGETLRDEAAAGEVLHRTPTLVVLDNLEALAPEPLRELLDAAVDWSEAGDSRVLITTRTPDMGHSGFRPEGTNVHRRIELDSLGSRKAPDDALEWYAALAKLPPAPVVAAPPRDALIALFDRVRFHPLSILVLATQVKTRSPAELGARLEALLAAGPAAKPGATDVMRPELVASLALSLDRLDPAARQILPRLGVFSGGAFEDDLLYVTWLGESYPGERDDLAGRLAALERRDPRAVAEMAGVALPDEVPAEVLAEIEAFPQEVLDAEIAGLRSRLAGLAENHVWPDLRSQLEAAALVTVEAVPGVRPVHIRFHPTLGTLLWGELDSGERERLVAAHRKRYAEVARYLYQKDVTEPEFARVIARRDLPNLLAAVDAAFEAGDPGAADFADSVTRFLRAFGLTREGERLTVRAEQAAAGGPDDGETRYLAQWSRGSRLFEAGRAGEAVTVFKALLDSLGEDVGFRRATTLASLGESLRAAGRPDLAAIQLQESMALTVQLEPSESVTRLTSRLHTLIGDTLLSLGRYAEARLEYEAGLAISKQMVDILGQAVSEGQLGALALRERNLDEALERYGAALDLFQRVGDAAAEATSWHQLGMVFQEARQWDEAERHYRESARIEIDRDNLAGAAITWSQLAILNAQIGKPEAAEGWIREAIGAYRKLGESSGLAGSLQNLANLLRSQPGRLGECRELAEEALAIKHTLDPGAAEIWKTYRILAGVCESEAEGTVDATEKSTLRAEAREHRRLAREAARAFPGTRQALKQHVQLIVGAVAANDDAEVRTLLDGYLTELETDGWTNLVGAVRRILAGERDADSLDEGLDSEDSPIVDAILVGLDDPSTLSDLLPEDASNEEGA